MKEVRSLEWVWSSPLGEVSRVGVVPLVKEVRSLEWVWSHWEEEEISRVGVVPQKRKCSSLEWVGHFLVLLVEGALGSLEGAWHFPSPTC